MLANYPGIAKHVRMHWQAVLSGSTDPFQPLFVHARLEDAINVETGIEDLMRSRQALEAYRMELESQFS